MRDEVTRVTAFSQLSTLLVASDTRSSSHLANPANPVCDMGSCRYDTMLAAYTTTPMEIQYRA